MLSQVLFVPTFRFSQVDALFTGKGRFLLPLMHAEDEFKDRPSAHRGGNVLAL